MADKLLKKDISDDRTQRVNWIIRLLLIGLIFVSISVELIGQTTEEDEEFLLSLGPLVMTALYHRAETDKASFVDTTEINSEASQKQGLISE